MTPYMSLTSAFSPCAPFPFQTLKRVQTATDDGEGGVKSNRLKCSHVNPEAHLDLYFAQHPKIQNSLKPIFPYTLFFILVIALIKLIVIICQHKILSAYKIINL